MNLDEQIQRVLSEVIENAAQRCFDEALAMEPLLPYSSPEARYARYIEYGKPPTKEANVVEGSIVEPITDEGRLLK